MFISLKITGASVATIPNRMQIVRKGSDNA
jgi:hypothetical protein